MRCTIIMRMRNLNLEEKSYATRQKLPIAAVTTVSYCFIVPTFRKILIHFNTFMIVYFIV